MRPALFAAGVACSLLAAACSSAAPASHASGNGAGTLSSLRLAVVPQEAAAQEKKYQAAGATADARLVARLADQPTAYWLAKGSPSSVRDTVRGIVSAAGDRAPVFVLYDIPGRDCGQFSSGGVADRAAYAAWVKGVVAGLGSASAIVVLEPDAVPQTLPEGDCPELQQPDVRARRYAELSDAVTTLNGDGNAHVYLDAGNAGWIQDLPALASALKQSGIDRAAGFALNVSSFYTTAGSTGYGRALSRDLGGAHFVIDTSRNGNGYYSAAAGDTAPTWCNPPGRKLGKAPTTTTGQTDVDAYLWVKVPGESDGTCRGGPDSGDWWASYALALVRDSGG